MVRQKSAGFQGLTCFSKHSCVGMFILNVFISCPSIINRESIYVIPKQPLEHLPLHKKFKETQATTIFSLTRDFAHSVAIELPQISAKASFPCLLSLYIFVYVCLRYAQGKCLYCFSLQQYCPSKPSFQGLRGWGCR